MSPTLLENAGLKALTVPEEQQEIKLVAFGIKHSGESKSKAAELRGHRIVFAFFQSDFQGGEIPYWHVTDPLSPSYKSTLSMEGLHSWGIL